MKQLTLEQELKNASTPPELRHVCHARACNVAVPPTMLMCLRHWRLVPTHVKRAVWQNYRRGQCDDKRPSREWMEAADAAIGFLAKKEGHGVSENERKAMVRYRL